MELSKFEKDRRACFNFLLVQIMRGGQRGGVFKRDNVPEWMGHKVLKFPEDLLLYQRMMHRHKPEVLVETGTRFGGSALFFANMFDLIGGGQVVTIDTHDFANKPQHPRITYILGSSIDKGVVREVKAYVEGKTCMVVLDSLHAPEHVRQELEIYHKLVTPKQYLVVEDVYDSKYLAPVVDSFLDNHSEFMRRNVTKHFAIHLTLDGWLQRQTS